MTKMQIMEDVTEGCSLQPNSPGHAEERLEEAGKIEENGFETTTPNTIEENDKETPKEDKIDDLKPEVELELIDENIETNHHPDESNSSTSGEENHKRKSEDTESPNKRLRTDLQESFFARDKILNEFIEMADCNSVEQLHTQSEQILAEIRTLNELAREKEREWNNIIHLKKMKEELLLRMQRRKQVMILNGDKVDNGESNESQTEGLKNSNQSILKANLMNPGKRLNNKKLPPKPQYQEINGNGDYRQNRQRPVLDVQSIIADYRQRHPETVPRRGRRIRNPPRNSGQSNLDNDLGLLLQAMDTVSHPKLKA